VVDLVPDRHLTGFHQVSRTAEMDQHLDARILEKP
jgi:hypothetical protein